MKNKVRKLIVAAAGNGTRLHPITRVIPKEMVPIINKPIIDYVLEENVVDAIEEVLLVVNSNRDLLFEYLNKNNEIMKGRSIKKIYQIEDKYGDAIPVLSAERFLKDEELFLVAWSDSFSLHENRRIESIVNVANSKSRPVISLLPISERETKIYAIADVEKVGKNLYKVKQLLEKPGINEAPSFLAAPNGFVLDNNIFGYIKNLSKNKKGEYSLIDAINEYCKDYEVLGFVSSEYFFEAGNTKDLVNTIMRLHG